MARAAVVALAKSLAKKMSPFQGPRKRKWKGLQSQLRRLHAETEARRLIDILGVWCNLDRRSPGNRVDAKSPPFSQPLSQLAAKIATLQTD
jgi:hypothetical protein